MLTFNNIYEKNAIFYYSIKQKRSGINLKQLQNYWIIYGKSYLSGFGASV